MEERTLIEFNKRIKKLEKINITIDSKLIPTKKIRGIYGFFAKKETKEYCFYIGKSNNIFIRLLGSNSHLNNYLRGVRSTDVHKNIEQYLFNGYSIHVKVLEIVEYKGNCFEQDANILALAELKQLVYYQDQNQCKNQLSEAVKVKREKTEWDSLFVKKQ